MMPSNPARAMKAILAQSCDAESLYLGTPHNSAWATSGGIAVSRRAWDRAACTEVTRKLGVVNEVSFVTPLCWLRPVTPISSARRLTLCRQITPYDC